MNAEGPFQVVPVDYAAALDELRAVRELVFVQEQQVPPELEVDGIDPECRHVLARDNAGVAIGTARLSADGRIGRMAVLRGWRGRGVGSALLHAVLRLAREAGLERVTLHAQAGAIEFYRAHGFVPVGERFPEAGIEHQAMALRLGRPLAVESRQAAVATTAAIVLAARRHLRIHSRELDPGLYDQAEVLEALRRFATDDTGREVRILLHDAAAVARAHAPLIGLAQRLPSVFSLREVDDPVDRADPSACIVNDAGGYYLRALGHRFDGETERDARARARQLSTGFDQAWERARACSELRALGI